MHSTSSVRGLVIFLFELVQVFLLFCMFPRLSVNEEWLSTIGFCQTFFRVAFVSGNEIEHEDFMEIQPDILRKNSLFCLHVWFTWRVNVNDDLKLTIKIRNAWIRFLFKIRNFYYICIACQMHWHSSSVNISLNCLNALLPKQTMRFTAIHNTAHYKLC